MRPVLLLGGHGFIGTALALRLRREGYAVDAPGRTEETTLPCFLSGYGTVVHLASSTTPGSSAQRPELEQANLNFTQRLVDALQALPDIHLIFFSSGGTVYGNPSSLPVREDAPLAPLSPHGAAKISQEKMCMGLRAHGHMVSILRPSNAYGPGQIFKKNFGLIRTLMEHARRGTELHVWGDGETVRDYVYINDLVDATLRLIALPHAAGTYNLGSGVGYSVNQVKAIVEEKIGRIVPTRYFPAREVDVRAIVLDVQQLHRAIHWRPDTTLAEGVQQTWRAFL